MSEHKRLEACKTKYVYLEMILNKDSKYDVLCGLFKGITGIDGETYILLHGLKNSTNVLNLRFYNIMTIEELEDDYKNMTYLTAEDNDQKTALDMITALYKCLTDAGFVVRNDEKIIDIDKYTEVPEEYVEGKTIDKGTTATRTVPGVGTFAAPSTRYQGAANNYSKTTIKKEPEPSNFGRMKGKKPSKESIDKILEKLDQIRAGTYKQDLPETLGEDDAGTTDADADDDGNINSYYGSGYC